MTLEEQAQADAKTAADKAAADLAAAEAAKSITVTIGGKQRTFASTDEMVAELERLNTAASDGDRQRAEAARLQAKYATALKAVGGDRESLRQLYRDSGTDDASIDEMFSKMDELNRVNSGGGAAETETPPVVTKRLNLKDLDEESQAFIGDMVRRSKAATRVVIGQNMTNIRDSLAGDKVIERYWPNLTDAQKTALMNQARQAVDAKLKNGEILEDADLAEALNKARLFATTVWPDPSALEAPGTTRVVPVVGRGESDELSVMSDTELDKKDDHRPVMFDGSKEDDARLMLRMTKIKRGQEARERRLA